MLFCRCFLQSFFILCIGFPPQVSSSALYRIQALHPNAQPVAPGDELAFLDGTEGATFAGEDSLHPTRCPVDVVALGSEAGNHVINAGLWSGGSFVAGRTQNSRGDIGAEGSAGAQGRT